MKKSTITLCFLFSYQILLAQVQKSLSIGAYRYFVSTDNAAIMYHSRKDKREWGIGLKYHFNRSIWDNGHINQRNMYSHHPEQNWGLMGEYRRYLWNQKKWNRFIQPYFVYNMAVSYKEVQSIGYGYIIAENRYDYFLIYTPQCLIVDNNIGLGIRFNQYGKWNGFIQTGVGLGLGKGVPSADIFRISYSYSEPTYMVSGGFTYNLSTQKAEKKKKK